jgi:heptosyltransferase-2
VTRPPDPGGQGAEALRVLVVHPAFLGDTVFLGPATRALKARWPAGRVAVVVTPRGAPVARLLPGVDEVVVFDKRGSQSGPGGLWRLAASLRGRFDLALVSHYSARSGLLAWLAGIPRRLGYALLCSERFPLDRSRPFVERALRLAERAGAPGHPGLELRAPAEHDGYAARVLAGARGPVVGLVPGAEWPTKRWGASHYAALARALGGTAVVLGGPGERDLAAAIVREAGGDVRDTTGNAIDEAIALLARCDLVVGGDTGLVHCARALGRPTAVLFGPTHVERHLFGPREAAVSLGLDCQPCHDHGPRECPLGHLRCMNGLEPGRVAGEARRLLDAPGPGGYGPAATPGGP